MNVASETFPHLLELCMRHLLTGNYTTCAGIAQQVLALSPNESAFHQVIHVCQRGLHNNAAAPSTSTSSLRNVTEHESNESTEDSPNERECQDTQLSSLYWAILNVAEHPHHLPGHERLIELLIHLNRSQETIQAVERCVQFVKGDGAWLAKLADFLLRIGQRSYAKRLYIAALEKLDSAGQEKAFLALGELEKQEKNYKESEVWFRRALQIGPENYANQREIINLYLHTGDVLTAKNLAHEFFSLNPKSLSLFLLKTCLQLQPGYESEKQLEENRQAFSEGLDVVQQHLPTIPERILPDYEFLVDNLNPFYLAYQGKDTIALQRAVARIAESMMQRFLPLPALEARPPIHGRKIKIGIISAFFRDHSNYKIPIKGWLKELNRNSFETFGYHVCSRVDSKTEEAATYFDRFVQGPHRLAEWVNLIRADTLDVLLYPEIGMDPTCRKLACFRLAPVQVNSWGHPVTSGLSTIDYYLSSDLMEGPDSDKEYTEKLIRLPKLSINYDPPKRTLLPIARPHMGLRNDAVVYWCCQVVYKYLPQFDWVYAEIASRMPNSQFVFITIQPTSEICLLFKRRMTKAFEERGLDPEKYLVFLSGLNGDEFATVASLCDLSLDAFEWSGCNSSLETMAQGVPVITCPGHFMRGRHTEAILRLIQCEELITATPQSFIELAVTLGKDASHRSSISAKVCQNIHLAYHDSSCVRELERCLTSWAESSTL